MEVSYPIPSKSSLRFCFVFGILPEDNEHEFFFFFQRGLCRDTTELADNLIIQA